MAAVGQQTAETFMDALKGVGKDKMTSDALIGGAAGIGLNMGANTVNGDSGGYVGAAALGGGGGAIARAAVKHFNLGPALESTFSKAKALNKYTGSTTDDVDRGASKFFRNKDGSEGSISAYDKQIAAKERLGQKQNDQGLPGASSQTNSEVEALSRRREDLKYKQYSNSMMNYGEDDAAMIKKYGQEDFDKYSSRLGRESKGKFGTAPTQKTDSSVQQWSPEGGGGQNSWVTGGSKPVSDTSSINPLQAPEGYAGTKSTVNIQELNNKATSIPDFFNLRSK